MNKIEDYLNNQDVIKVANNAAKSFKNILSQDEIKNCILNAIWKASKKFDPNSNTKFTSYVHRGVVYECLSQRKFNLNKSTSPLTLSIPDNHNAFESVDMKDLVGKVCEDPQLVIDRFYKNMTITELAKSRNVCGETIRTRLQKNLQKMKLSLLKSV